jgi:uncharacterized protein (UPF0332 family)
MDEDIRAVIQLRVGRAQEELQAARRLVEDGFYRIACSRAYYSAFLMTTATLLTQNLIRSKHSGVQATFGERFVKSGLIEDEYGRIYTLLRNTREDTDYNDRVVVNEAIARERLAEAHRFVERLERYLREIGALE